MVGHVREEVLSFSCVCIRYWGDEVAVGGVSLAGLHQMARQRAVARQRWPEAGEGSGGHGEGEVVEEGLPPLTHLRRSAVAVAVHHRLPDWITRPRLVAADIGSGSAPLSSVALPAVVSSNLRAMGYTSLFPVQVGVGVGWVRMFRPWSQVEVIPELLAGLSLPPRDVCVCAPTGCGKTLCYVVPMVTALLNCVVCQVCCKIFNCDVFKCGTGAWYCGSSITNTGQASGICVQPGVCPHRRAVWCHMR